MVRPSRGRRDGDASGLDVSSVEDELLPRDSTIQIPRANDKQTYYKYLSENGAVFELLFI